MTNPEPLQPLRDATNALVAQRAAIIAASSSLANAADAAASAARSAAVLADSATFQSAGGRAADLRAQARASTAQLSAADDQLAQLIAALAGDPCDLEADVPLVLLPVRLETRYSADGATLRVRIYPDDVHVDRLDRGISDDERAAAVTYWTALWAGTSSDDDAWQALVNTVHPARAAWVAEATSPDLATRPDPPAPLPLPVLAAPPGLLQTSPVARALPDRFVVVAIQGATVSRATGAPVPPELVVGLPPGADPDQLAQFGPNGITLGPGMQWLVDPDQAKAVGMLVEVPLGAPGGPVDTVLAFGVRESQGPADSATELAALFDAHRYATGAAFVSPGTPTNNTETDRTAWTARTDPGPPPTTAAAAASGSAGSDLAAALGLDPASFVSWDGSTLTTEPLAEAAQTALWQATWGTFIERLVSKSAAVPGISDAHREAWRDWWQQEVRGLGPLPLLRLGNQPYGVLPTSAVQSRWQPDGSDQFEPPLLTVLRNAKPLIDAGLAAVPSIGSGAALHTTLLEILGSTPHLAGIRVRSISSEAMGNAFEDLLDVPSDQVNHDLLTEAVFAQLGAAALAPHGTIGKVDRPLGLPLVLGDAVNGDAEYWAAMLAAAPRAVHSVLQALLEICYGREQAAVAAAAPPELVPKVVDLSSRIAQDQNQTYIVLAEQTVAGKIDPVRLHAAADTIDARFGASGVNELAVLQPVVAARTSLADFALSSAIPVDLAEQQAITALSAWFRAKARLADFEAAGAMLVAAPLADRQIAVAETLDCASHRYDAWVTSLSGHRLAALRTETPTGVLIGAYGWVEGLAPGVTTTRPGGYVHAPSLTHAATAGVLRSGYLTHNPDDIGSGALAVDLSSARVRAARLMLDGVRQGQPLGALVGYLIERLLHEQNLDVYTLSIRSLAPISAGKLVDRADALPPAAQEAVGANNVVDGVALLALPQDTIWAKLATPPADNPYLDPALWPDIDTNKPALIAILAQGADAYDAVSDLLLAESVHHLVQGNTARAGAAMGAAASGDAAPIDPDVVRTPTRAAAITHRVVVLVDDTAAGSGGWSPDTPRALVEPRIAAWAEAQLGPANEIVVQVAIDGTRTTLDAAALSALDIIFDCAGARVSPGPSLTAPVLEAHLRATITSLSAEPLAMDTDPSWPVGMRAVGEVAVRAASVHHLLAAASTVTPSSFARPNDPPARTADPTSGAALAARLVAAVSDFATATTGLATALALASPDLKAVGVAVDALRAYGIALPAGGIVGAHAVLAEAQARVSALAAPAVAADPVAGAQALFGKDFLALVAVSGAADLFAATVGALDPGRAAIRRWLRDVATVRPAVARYAETLLFADSAAAGRPLRIAQLAATGTAGTSTWLGLPLPAGTPSPDQPVTDVVLDAPSGYVATDPIAGFVVDEWVEQLPHRDLTGTASITTGVAVNANAPNSRAPQAILLAVSPDGQRWTSDALLDVLRETRELAGLRAVTLERQASPSPIMPAIQEQSWSLQGDPTLDIRFLATEVSQTPNMLQFVKETGP